MAQSRVSRAGERGSVFVLVLWISFGLVVLALYFGQSMNFELRSADNRVASMEAEQAIAGALRYAIRVVTNVDLPGRFPDMVNTPVYQAQDVPVGDAAFWFIGRSDNQTAPDLATFALTDESGKINLNTANSAMLESLPRMTAQLAGAILDWRDGNTTVNTNGGAEEETYALLVPPRHCKNARFETVEELQLVAGMDIATLYGEDTNLNGVLDPNENDGDSYLPSDNNDGSIQPGLLEYVTVHSRQPNTRTNGQLRIDVRTQQSRQQLQTVLREKFEQQRAQQIIAAVGNRNINSVLEFFLRGQLTTEEAALIQNEITTSTNQFVEGLINVNTASETVLACIPGIGTTNAPALVAFRQSNPDKLTSVAWVGEALGTNGAIAAGPRIIGGTYQISADIAAVGHNGRGYHRVRFIIDTSETTPKVLQRRDLTYLGWALGAQTRENILNAEKGSQ